MPLNQNQLMEMMRQQAAGQVADFDPLGQLPGRGPRNNPPPIVRAPLEPIDRVRQAAPGRPQPGGVAEARAQPPIAAVDGGRGGAFRGGGLAGLQAAMAAAPAGGPAGPAGPPMVGPAGNVIAALQAAAPAPAAQAPVAPPVQRGPSLPGVLAGMGTQDKLNYAQEQEWVRGVPQEIFGQMQPIPGGGFVSERGIRSPFSAPQGSASDPLSILSRALGGQNGQIPSMQEFMASNQEMLRRLGRSPQEMAALTAPLASQYGNLVGSVYAGPEGPTQSTARMGALGLQGRERDTQQMLAQEAVARGSFERSPEGLRHAAALAQASTPGGIPGFNAGNVVQPQTGPDAELHNALATARSVEGYTDPATGRIRPDRMNNFITSFLNNVGMENVQREPQRYRAFLESVLDPMAVDTFARTSPGIFGRATPITRGAAVLRSAPAGRATPIAPVAPPGLTQPAFLPMGF